MQIIWRCHRPVDGCLIIDQVAIDIMLEDEATWIKPIVEDLTAHNMSANSPAIFILLFHQPCMAQHLDVEVKDLKAGVMDVELRPFEEEK